MWMWKFSLKKTNTKYELIRTCFSGIETDKETKTDTETNTVEKIYLTEQPFWNKITAGWLRNFSFLKTRNASDC